MSLSDLRKPFPPDRISWRIGSTTADKKKGMALAYIDARDVQDRLDEVCGIEGWQCRYVPMHDKKTVCEIGVRAETGEWIWKADGAGDSDVEAEKGALSDAFKRAAVKWGIGRYLYDIDSPWVEIKPAGKSYKIVQSEYVKLRAILSRGAPAAPAQQLPQDEKLARGTALSQARDAERTSQTAGSPQGAPKMTPAEWALQELPIIRAAPTPAALKAWEKLNAARMERLKSVDADAHRDILENIDARAKALLS